MNGSDTSAAPPALAGLGRSFRTWRVLRRMKQAHAAELFGVAQATISKWENESERPSARQAARMRDLMAAAPSGDADRALLDLVCGSADEAHLVCDLTHRLLAVSRRRARRWRVPGDRLIGVTLWPYATADIATAERRLAELGWFEPAPTALNVFTRANGSADVPIEEGWMSWTRMRLSDGSYARLVRKNIPGAMAANAA
ncbi:MAG: helix-turn-helix transcriptional regulator [Alphaproteobacteria bacterium]|nr:helix-turn-helix transcriptional regulator [Alphaproteobacteria bacterium]